MKTRVVICTLVLLTLSGLFARSAQSQQKRSRFAVTVDSLITEVDAQIQDRGKLIKVVNDLYQKLKDAELEGLDRQVDRARYSSIQREALLTADVMSLDPKSKARVSEIIAFLDRVVTRDQQLYDQYISSKESVRFEYERQLAKIKGEQAVLKSIRKDLERLKQLPGDKEQMQFMLGSIKTLLDGLRKVHDVLN